MRRTFAHDPLHPFTGGKGGVGESDCVYALLQLSSCHRQDHDIVFTRDPACAMSRIRAAHRTPLACALDVSTHWVCVSPQTRRIICQMHLDRSSRKRRRKSMGSTTYLRWRSTRRVQSRKWLSNVRVLCRHPTGASRPHISITVSGFEWYDGQHDAGSRVRYSGRR